jgi:hypothetical protein
MTAVLHGHGDQSRMVLPYERRRLRRGATDCRNGLP